MALVFQTWTLCITCTTMITVHSYIREKLLFLLETKGQQKVSPQMRLMEDTAS